MLEVFNAPAPDFSCERREASTVTQQVFSLFNSRATQSRALAFAQRVLREAPAEEKRDCLAHWRETTPFVQTAPASLKPPLEVRRDAIEENTGERFSFNATLRAYADFVPDLQPADVNARTRALADVCLVPLNSNEFGYVY